MNAYSCMIHIQEPLYHEQSIIYMINISGLRGDHENNNRSDIMMILVIILIISNNIAASTSNKKANSLKRLYAVIPAYI